MCSYDKNTEKKKDEKNIAKLFKNNSKIKVSQTKSGGNTLLYFKHKKLMKKLLFNYSSWSIY